MRFDPPLYTATTSKPAGVRPPSGQPFLSGDAQSSDATDAAARAGEDAWFATLYRAHGDAVFRFVARRAARSDVDDLTADVFLVAWRRRSDIPVGAELPWLYKTAGFLVAGHHRRRNPLPLSVVPDEGDPETPQWTDAAGDARRALAALPARDQRVLLLTAWEGLDGDGLAHALGITRGGAAAALSRARDRLRTVWKQIDATE